VLFYRADEGEELSKTFYTGPRPTSSDSGGRIPHEQRRRRRQALGAARHRLRLSAHDQQDPARVPQVEGRR